MGNQYCYHHHDELLAARHQRPTAATDAHRRRRVELGHVAAAAETGLWLMEFEHYSPSSRPPAALKRAVRHLSPSRPASAYSPQDSCGDLLEVSDSVLELVARPQVCRCHPGRVALPPAATATNPCHNPHNNRLRPPPPSTPFPNDDEDVVDARGFVDGVKLTHKCSKATVLGKAVEYILFLKNRERRLTRELSGLKTLLSSLVGGPALLSEWESEWIARFGGAERDELGVVDGAFGDDGEDDEDDSEGSNEEGEGRKRKKPKVEAKPKPKATATAAEGGEKKRLLLRQLILRLPHLLRAAHARGARPHAPCPTRKHGRRRRVVAAALPLPRERRPPREHRLPPCPGPVAPAPASHVLDKPIALALEKPTALYTHEDDDTDDALLSASSVSFSSSSSAASSASDEEEREHEGGEGEDDALLAQAEQCICDGTTALPTRLRASLALALCIARAPPPSASPLSPLQTHSKNPRNRDRLRLLALLVHPVPLVGRPCAARLWSSSITTSSSSSPSSSHSASSTGPAPEMEMEMDVHEAAARLTTAAPVRTPAPGGVLRALDERVCAGGACGVRRMRNGSRNAHTTPFSWRTRARWAGALGGRVGVLAGRVGCVIGLGGVGGATLGDEYDRDEECESGEEHDCDDGEGVAQINRIKKSLRKECRNSYSKKDNAVEALLRAVVLYRRVFEDTVPEAKVSSRSSPQNDRAALRLTLGCAVFEGAGIEEINNKLLWASRRGSGM
ncbi:hypothetical protein C8J57DRAFT_1480201 [Mycena rebaudengoi]|nr:hypothetical protein C8J57DRAFT_1480201 [Mycena rebaudengoi]